PSPHERGNRSAPGLPRRSASADSFTPSADVSPGGITVNCNWRSPAVSPTTSWPASSARRTDGLVGGGGPSVDEEPTASLRGGTKLTSSETATSTPASAVASTLVR